MFVDFIHLSDMIMSITYLQVALKTLIVIHRILREGDPTFREDLLNYSHKGHVLQISNFKDDSSPQGRVVC